ncbi:histidine phosphatase family protein [Microbacterium sp. H1-D42]|uniref:histidine phosphatase family protein n=1 Tax=Microbacterium sp. H1-D42 TaxID=2925844 RepID=UPI001F5332B5|nr:histidine phosphatase family protein [Microbacterium sp. H1-D42]UNK69291.1 histidine phosphatase family protein [Microbacterium sp. H1-D42]
MSRILLVRHAQAHGSEADDPALDEIGEQQATMLAARLVGEDVTRVLHSPKRRARQTAAAVVSRAECPTDTTALLDDRTPVPSADRWADYPSHRWDWLRETPADEADEDARHLTAAWAELSAGGQSDSGTLVLVTHAFVIASFLNQVLAAPPAAWMQLRVANASVTELELRPGVEPAVLGFNDVSHLRVAH